MIIWLASYPRSGNTFFRMLLYHGCGFKTYSLYNDPLFDELDASETIGHESLPASVEELSRAPETYFVKTHDLPVDSNPAIYLARDGRDTVVSTARYDLSFKRKTGLLASVKRAFCPNEFHKTLKRRITNRKRYGGWNDNVMTWLNRPAGVNQLVIRFEDLIRTPDEWVQKAINQFKLQPKTDSGKMPDFDTLHSRWPQFFRKGKCGAWRDEMPADLHELFWQHNGEAMRALGYAK